MNLGIDDPDVGFLASLIAGPTNLSTDDESGVYLHKLFKIHENIFMTNAASLRYKTEELRVQSIDMELLCIGETWLYAGIKAVTFK